MGVQRKRVEEGEEEEGGGFGGVPGREGGKRKGGGRVRGEKKGRGRREGGRREGGERRKEGGRKEEGRGRGAGRGGGTVPHKYYIIILSIKVSLQVFYGFLYTRKYYGDGQCIAANALHILCLEYQMYINPIHVHIKVF